MSSKRVFSILGASNHSSRERQKDDYYATDPIAMKLLLEQETFNHNILEPSCGEGHLSKVMQSNGYTVESYDLVDRGFGKQEDFFNITDWNGDVVTNPPYKLAKQFIEHSLEITKNGAKIAMFLKLTFMESKGRKQFFIDNPPKFIYVSSSRIQCAINGDFENVGATCIAHAWYVWEKGFKGNSTVKWIN